MIRVTTPENEEYLLYISQGLKITSETGLPYWDGETTDYDFAVTTLTGFDEADSGEYPPGKGRLH